MSRHVEHIVFFLSSTRVVPPVLRPNSRTLPNLKEHGNVFRQNGKNHLKMSTCRTQIQKLGLHVPMCRRYVARVTAFPGKCREMSKTPTNRDRRQMSKRMSRHVRLGQAAGEDVLWRKHIQAIWQGEVPHLKATEARDFYRCMRQPPAVMTAASAASVIPPAPRPLSDVFLGAPPSDLSLGEYRLLVEVTLDEDGRKLLTAVVKSFHGMLIAERTIPAGQRTAAFSTAAPPEAPEELSLPVMPYGMPYRGEWLREAFGGYRTWGCWEGRTPVRRLSARLCVLWQDKVVCLGVAPGMNFNYSPAEHGVDDARDRCQLIFQWHMPAIAVPDVVAGVVQETPDEEDWRMKYISPVLLVNVEACSAAHDTWKADSFELQVQPQIQLPASIDDDEEPEEEVEFGYDDFEQDCESDEMSLCFFHEAMAMSRRSVGEYACPEP